MNTSAQQIRSLVGNLYSRDGISFLLRTLLARPTTHTILLCGKDMTGSGAALLALMRDGLDEAGRIAGDGTRLHPEIPPEVVELLRRSVRLHDARDTVRPEEIAALLGQLRRPAEPFAPAPLSFPYREPVAAALPAADTGLLLRDRFVRGAYLKLIWHVLSFGVRGGTQHSSDQHQILYRALTCSKFARTLNSRGDKPSPCSKCRARPPPTTAGPRSSTAGRRGEIRSRSRLTYHTTEQNG